MALSVKRVASILTFGLAAFENLVQAEQTQRPLRLMLNSDVLTTLFNKGDQRMLEAFSDLPITIEEKSQTCPEMSGATFSVATQEGVDVDSYDFDVSLNDAEKGYLGFEGKDLRIKGKVTLAEGKEVGFTAPVTKLRLEAEYIPEDNNDVLEINKNAEKPTVKLFDFQVGSVAFEDSSLGEGCQTQVHQGLIDTVIGKYEQLWAGDLDSLAAMPVESFLPMIFIRHIGGFAMEQNLNPTSIEFGFDPEMIFEKVRPTPKKKADMLKAIESEFSMQSDSKDPTMLSFIIDENAINSFLLEFVLIERAFSFREFLKGDQRLADIQKEMNTSSLAVLLPSVVEEYGEGRPIDFYFSMSHSLLNNKLEGIKPTGFQMDKNGNFKFVFNVTLTLLVDKKNKQWEEARSAYVSFTAKGKVTTNTTNKKGERVLSIFPKSAEMSQLKIYDKDDKEQEMEQMLLVSGFNLQMDQLFKMVKPFEMPMKNLPTPKEMECLGITLSDLNLNFKKGYVEMTCGYKKVDRPSDPKVCEKFFEALTEGPKQAKSNVDSLFGGKSAKEFLEEKSKEFEASYDKLQETVKDSGSKGDDNDDETVVIEEL